MERPMSNHIYEIENEETERCESVYSDIKCLSNQELLQTLLSNKVKASDLEKLEKSFETFKELFFCGRGSSESHRRNRRKNGQITSARERNHRKIRA
jgi:hypothetical protein